MSMGTFIQITATGNNIDRNDWALMLLRMYRIWAEKHGHPVEIWDYQDGEFAGIASATLYIKRDLYSLLRKETGMHWMKRKSPFTCETDCSNAVVRIFPEAETIGIPTALVQYSGIAGKSIRTVGMTYEGEQVWCSRSRDLLSNIHCGLVMLQSLKNDGTGNERPAHVRGLSLMDRTLTIGQGEAQAWDINAVLNGEIDEFLNHTEQCKAYTHGSNGRNGSFPPWPAPTWPNRK